MEILHNAIYVTDSFFLRCQFYMLLAGCFIQEQIVISYAYRKEKLFDLHFKLNISLNLNKYKPINLEFFIKKSFFIKL